MKHAHEPWLFVVVLGALVSLAQAPAGAKPGYPTVGRIERLDPRFDALIPPGAVLEKVAEGMVWTEGPLWDAKDGSLLFSDVPRNGIFRWKEASGVTQFLRESGYTGTEPFKGREPGSNGLAFDREGRLVMCQHGNRRIVRREPDGRFTVLADRYQGKRLNSPNDLVFRSNGDLYFTDPPFGLPGTFTDPAKEVPFQGVYRLTPDGTLTALVTDLGAPNGIGFSPDEKTLYVSNAEHKRPIWMAYEVRPDGSLGTGRQFAEAAAVPCVGKPQESVPGGEGGLGSAVFSDEAGIGPGQGHRAHAVCRSVVRRDVVHDELEEVMLRGVQEAAQKTRSSRWSGPAADRWVSAGKGPRVAVGT